MIKFINKLLVLNSKQKKRIINNIFSGASAEGVQILVQICFAPLMLLFWGMENFGIWIFLLSIPNIFLIFNINMADAAIQEITMFQSKRKIKKANEIFQNSIILVLLNIIIITILIIFFYFFYQVDFSILNNIKTDELTIILLLLFASTYINLFQSIFITGIYSQGKLYVGYNITSIVEVLSKASIVFSGIVFDSLIYPAIIYFLYSVVKFFLIFYFFRIYNTNLYFSFKLVSKKILKKIIKLSIGHTSDIITFIIKHSGIIIILGIFYDAYIIGYVATVKTLFYFFPVRFFSKLDHVSLYEYASLFAKKKLDVIKKNLIGFTKIILFFLLLFIAISIIIGPFVYNLWLNDKYELGFLFLLLIIFDAVFFTLRHSIISIFRAINKYVLLGVSELLFSIIALAIFYFAIYFGNSYLVGFSIILLQSLISLIFSLVFLWFFFMNKSNIKHKLFL